MSNVSELLGQQFILIKFVAFKEELQQRHKLLLFEITFTADVCQPWTDLYNYHFEYLIIRSDYLIIAFDYLIIE